MFRVVLITFVSVVFKNVGANDTVMSKHITRYEMDTVQLSCFSNFNQPVVWGVDNTLQHKLKSIKHYGSQEHSPIYIGRGDILEPFRNTGRYSISVGNNFYNLTIFKLNVSETGKYICFEDQYTGPVQITYLSVLVNVSLFQTYQTLSIRPESNVTLPCRANLDGPVRWDYIKSMKSSQHVIFSEDSVQSDYMGKFTVKRLSGEYNLSLHNVQLNESGWYICIEDSSSLYMRPFLLDVWVDVTLLQNYEEVSIDAGRNVTLPCRANLNSYVRWVYVQSVNSSQHVLFRDDSVKSGYMGEIPVYQISGDYNLLLHNVQLNESGWYICIEDSSSPIHMHPILLEVHDDTFEWDSLISSDVVIVISVLLPVLVVLAIAVTVVYVVYKRRSRRKTDENKMEPLLPPVNEHKMEPLLPQVKQVQWDEEGEILHTVILKVAMLFNRSIDVEFFPADRHQWFDSCFPPEHVCRRWKTCCEKNKLQVGLHFDFSLKRVGHLDTRLSWRGFTQLKDEVIVVYDDRIEVYKAQEPFLRWEERDISYDFSSVWDVVGDSETQQLFIVSMHRLSSPKIVRRIRMEPIKISKFTELSSDSTHVSLSVTAGRLLSLVYAIANSGTTWSMSVYSVNDGIKPIEMIESLPPFIQLASGAVETRRKTVIVSYSSVEGASELVEMNWRGEVLRHHNKNVEDTHPICVALDSIGRVLVESRRRIGNDNIVRLVMLDQELHFIGCLFYRTVSSFNGLGQKASYNAENKWLVWSVENHDRIDLYKCY